MIMEEEFDYQKYWNERLSGQFGLENVGYIGLGKNFNTWMYRLRKRNFLRSVKKLKDSLSNARILDVGSGTGFYVSLWLASKVQSVTGVDISVQAVQNLKATYPSLNFHVQDISKSCQWHNEFDVISCMDVLFHVVNDNNFKSTILNLSQSLRSGGILILTDNFIHGSEKRMPHHVSRPLAEYERILEESGLKIVSRKPVFCFLNYPVDSNSRVLKLVWTFFLRFIPGNEKLGYLTGMLFFPIDLLLTRVLSEGPSTEIMICKKL